MYTTLSVIFKDKYINKLMDWINLMALILRDLYKCTAILIIYRD
jgi:hypothetical protein